MFDVRRGSDLMLVIWLTSAEVGETGMEDIEGAQEVGLELVADVIVVLVFARADDTVAGAVGDDVDAAPVVDRLLDHVVDGRADADVAEEGKVAIRVCLEGVLSRCEVILVAPAYGGDKVVVGESGLCYGSANAACSSEYLETSINARGKMVLETHHPDKLLWRIMRTWRATARGKLELAGARHGGRVRRYPRGRYFALIFHDTYRMENGTTAVVVQFMDTLMIQ
ncbi:MAG: hypothetical protein Q9172_007513 [Xanthocarpia lactea]